MSPPLGLFQGFGVEMEYMIVRRDDLSVFPFSDEIIKHVSGVYESEVSIGSLAWCNEVVLHVLEIKTDGPASDLENLPEVFHESILRINAFLERHGAMLLPTGMHPFMDPLRETRLWPHEYSAVYGSYDRIFGCRGHGWSNLQSLHLNLPFADDEEFGRLHAAIRVLLPILPALAASTPVYDGRSGGFLDSRLEVYRLNQQKIPSIAGRVIPEPVFDADQYRDVILERIYSDIRPYDDAGILQREWLNSRGAIARFERNTIEIRVLDLQECPRADLAIYAAVVEVLKALVSERWSRFEDQSRWQVAPLADLLEQTMRQAGAARIESDAYLRLFGYPGKGPISVSELWRHLVGSLLGEEESPWREPLECILSRGCLAERILQAVAGDFSRARLVSVYRRLAEALARDRLFTG